MLAVEQSPELIQYSSGGLAFECANHIAQYDGWRVTHQEVDMIGVPINLSNFAVAFRGELPQDGKQKVSPLSGEYMTPKLSAKDDVCRQVVDTVACCVKVKIPERLRIALMNF